MAEFTIHLMSPHPAGATFRGLVDWDAHSSAIPLTRLQHRGAPAVGQQFVARTGVGGWGFDDPMQIVRFEAPEGDRPGVRPGSVEVVKTGRVLHGRVAWTVTPTGTGSRVDWHQNLTVPWLPNWLDPLIGAIGEAAYRAGLRRLLRRITPD